MKSPLSHQSNTLSSTQSSPAAEIMVVDDTTANLHLVIKLLADQGYHLRPITDGVMALDSAFSNPPDVILLDVQMPGMDGYEVCKRLKADERTCDIPVIFLTVLDDEANIVKGFELGGVDYITKPVRAGELLARVKNQVALRSLQNRLIENEEFLRSVYNGVEAAISIIDVLEDGQFRVVEANDTARRMSGLSREQIEGIDLRKLVPEHVIQNNHQVCVDQGISLTKEGPVPFNGQMIWWLATHTPMRNKQGKIVRLIETSINITDRKQAEQQLADKTEELSQTLETLQATQAELIRSAKMAALGNLVAGVAHEINTPVGTAIMTASTLENATQSIAIELKQGELKRSSLESYLEVAAECSGLILNNLHRAGELVTSFKQVAVDQTSLQKRVFPIKPYLQEVLTNLTPQLNTTHHQVKLLGDDTITVNSYPGGISQIITNLVTNSLTHAYPNEQPGTLCITVAADPDTITITYHDDGCGIPLEDHSRIFEPFFTTARHRGGSGLGLHLVYNLVTQTLNGTIEVASQPGNGTTFTITFPNQ